MADPSLQKMLEGALADAMCEVLALESHEVDPEENLSEYGFDSITLTELAGAIVRRFPFMTLGQSTFLERPTLSQVAAFLATKYGSALLESSDAPAPVRESRTDVGDRDIAIIGMAGRFPGAESVADLWKTLVQEQSTFSRVPPERWAWRDYFGDPEQGDGKTDCCYGAFLDDVARFDAGHFGISPAEAELLDPQHRLLLEVAWETLENAGYCKSALQKRRVGVFVGVEKQEYKELLNASRFALDPQTNTGNTHSVLVNRVSHFFDWRGPSVAVDTACSSSMTAIAQACDALRSGGAELAVAGGINLLLTPWIFVVNRKLRMLTNEAVMRPFDRKASGHLNGEGVALILLKRRSKAIADGDIIYGVIRGIAARHGGRGVFLTAPNPAGHRAVIEEALSDAGLSPGDIDYVEAQGTADHEGDRVELKTYQAVFGGARTRPVMIGTSKGNVGHLGAASGVAAIIKTVLSFRNHTLPRVPHLEQVNWTEDDGALQCECVSRTQDWPSRSTGSLPIPRRAAVHNFGYGGVNAHAILEEYPARLACEADAGPHVIALSARTQEQLTRSAENLLAFLRDREYQHYGVTEPRLSALAYTLQVGREPMEYRLAMVVSDLADLTSKLTAWCRGASAAALVFSGRAHRLGTDTRHGALAGLDAAALAQTWVAGDDVAWAELHGEITPERMPLPTYPFARDRYWIPQESAAAAAPRIERGDAGSGDVELLVMHDIKQHVGSLLKIAPPQLEEHRNFVDSGFTSLTLAQLARNLSSWLGIDVRPPALFSHPSIHQLSAHLVSSHRPALQAFYKLPSDTPKTPPQTRTSMPRKVPAVPGPDDPIAVIGMSGRFPGADSVDALWSILAAGTSVISEIPSDRWDWRPYYRGPGDAANGIATNRGGFMTGVGEFDPLFFDLSPREAELIDPRQRLLLQEAWRAFEDAGYAGRRLRGSSCGVFVGVEEGDYEKRTGDDGLLTGNHNGILASRIGYYLDLQGPSLSINAACSSGLVAVHLACQSLQRGETNMALAGAVHLLLSPRVHQQLTRLGMLSESGQGFAFDERADGIVPGEAVAALVLKRLSVAIEDGDHIRGVIRGCGLNYKGKTNGVTAPSGLSQRRLIEETYRKCGVTADDIDYVAAHGTGTKMGDPVEVEALTEAFRATTSRTGYCALGSVTPNLGHTFAVSGIVGLIAVLLGMKHNTIPALASYEKGNDSVSLPGSPFYVPTTAVPWMPHPSGKRRAAVSAFGISGTNAHVVLEEYPVPVPPDSAITAAEPGARSVIVPLSARQEDRLREYAGRLLAQLKQDRTRRIGESRLADLAYTLQTGREAMDYRAAFVVKDIRELVDGLEALLDDRADVNCHRGRAQKELAIIQAIGSDEDMQETIRRWMDHGKLRNAAALWAIGADIDWERFRSGDERRIPLPSYPFARRVCWAHAPKAQPPPSRAEMPASEGASASRVELTPQAIERDVTRHVCEALRLEEGEIETRKAFVEMGLNSVIGVELVSRLNGHYGLNLRATRLYDYANIVQLAKSIHQELAGRQGAAVDPDPTGSIEDRVRDVLRQLAADALTLDAAEELIDDRLSSVTLS
jgi:acyl transferase domain-containing protein